MRHRHGICVLAKLNVNRRVGSQRTCQHTIMYFSVKDFVLFDELVAVTKRERRRMFG